MYLRTYHNDIQEIPSFMGGVGYANSLRAISRNTDGLFYGFYDTFSLPKSSKEQGKELKKRGFPKGADTGTSCTGTRLMIGPTTRETYPSVQFITLSKVMNVNGCVAWSLPSSGITEDLGPLFFNFINSINGHRNTFDLVKIDRIIVLCISGSTTRLRQLKINFLWLAQFLIWLRQVGLIAWLCAGNRSTHDFFRGLRVCL